MFDRNPQPVWKVGVDELAWPKQQAKVIPITFDGRYWIENMMMHGARSQRVVRHGWPHFDAEEKPDTDLGWPSKMERSQDIYTRDLRMAAERSYLSILSYWPLVVAVLGLIVAWKVLPLLIFLPVLSLFCYWGTVVVRGGFGNVPIAKDILGIDRPFILTTYQLDQHVSRKREVQIAEGLSEPA